MEYHNNTLCIEAGWLIENGIISENNYRRMQQRKHLNVVRRACRNTPALVAYESIPSRFKADIIAKLGGDPYQIAKPNILEEHITTNSEASVFFESYRLSDGRRLPANTRLEYYNNAIILDAIHRIVVTKVARKKAMGGKMTHVWEHISEAVRGLDRTKYPHALPEYPLRLKDRYRIYIKEGYESLIHKNFTNNHAAKINDEVKEAVIIELLADPRNLDNEQVARIYNEMAENMGWQKISKTPVATLRDKHSLEIYPSRQGAVAAYNNKLMQVKRSAPTKPLYFWTLDGWDVELLYQKSEKGVTTYHHRPTVVIVLDPCCKFPIGYAVGTHETPELIKAALRNAAQYTAHLFGSMHRAHQIQSDRYAIKKMLPLYAAMGEKVTPTRAKNAKGKVIEPYFGYLNKTYCQLMPNWSGFGITSKKENQPNSEFLNKYKHNFPDFEGACMMVTMIVERERQAKMDEYLKLWGTMADSDKLALPYEHYLRNFGVSTNRRNLLQGNGLNVTIKGLKRTYDCFDINFRRYASTQWEIIYDPEDTTRVLATNENDTLSFILEEKHVQPMALRERQDGDAEALKRVQEFNEQTISYITDFRIETSETVRELYANHPELDGTLGRLMLTDSKGQHKNQRNAIRSKTQKAISTTAVDVSETDNETIYDKF